MTEERHGWQGLEGFSTGLDAGEGRRSECERAKVLQELLREQDLRKEADSRISFLVDAANSLFGHASRENTLVAAANLPLPEMADWCVIQLVLAPESGELDLAEVAAADPVRDSAARELKRHVASRRSLSRGPLKVLRTGSADLAPEVDDRRLEQIVGDGRHLSLARSLGVRSYVCVPIQIGIRRIGTLTFCANESSGRRYDRRDLLVAQAFAVTAAAALDAANPTPIATLDDRSFAKRQNTKASDLAPRLTPRQTEVLDLLARSRSVEEIHRTLSISEQTVRTHIRDIRQAFGVSCKREAVRLATEYGMLPDQER